MDTLDGMKTFVAVARQQSFTAGALSLGVSTKLASKYVQQLEQRLDAQLFHRTTRSVTLTEIGRAYFEQCLPLLDQFDELEELVQEKQSELAGQIKMTAPTGFGSSKLLEVLQPFQRLHPKVSFDLYLSDQYVDVVREGFDLALRFGDLKDSSLMARKLINMRLVVVASPEYLAKHKTLSHPRELCEYHCLTQYSSAYQQKWQFLIEGNLEWVDVGGVFHTNSPKAVAEMAAAGSGIGLCPYYTAEPFLIKGNLDILFEEFEARNLTLSAVYPPNQYLTARVRALIDFLALRLNEEVKGHS